MKKYVTILKEETKNIKDILDNVLMTATKAYVEKNVNKFKKIVQSEYLDDLEKIVSFTLEDVSVSFGNDEIIATFNIKTQIKTGNRWTPGDDTNIQFNLLNDNIL